MSDFPPNDFTISISEALYGKDTITCPRCGSDHIVKAGKRVTVYEGPKQRLRCQECGHTFYPPQKEEEKK